MRRIRLVIADRRPIVLQGFVSLFAAHPDFEIVASCLDGVSCLAAVRNLAPDIVLLEDGFTDVTAAEMLAAANAENLLTRLVFFTASVARGDLADAIAAGTCSSVSMSAEPETLLQSMRLVAPGSLPPPAGNEGDGAFASDVSALLTVNERTIISLAARGLSDKAIAHRLNISAAVVEVHLDHIFEKLGIKSRRELAAFARSNGFFGISALAALLFAIDDPHAAALDVADTGHTIRETFAVLAADGTAEVVSIVVSRPKESAYGSTARAVSKARAVSNAATGTSLLTRKSVDDDTDMPASSFALAVLNAVRPSSGGYSAFMMAAVAAWIYALDSASKVAQAFDFGDGPADVSTSASANGTRSDRPFAFNSFRGDTSFQSGDEAQIIYANAWENSAGGKSEDGSAYARPADGPSDRSDTVPEGSGAVNALALEAASHHDGQSQRDLRASAEGATASEQHATHDASEDSSRGQSQRDLHGSEDGSTAPAQHAGHDASDDASSRGQSQRNVHASKDDPAAPKQHAKHDASEDHSNPGQAQRNVHASEDEPAAPKQHGKHDAPVDHSNAGQAQRDVHASKEDPAAPKQHAKHDASENDSSPGQSHRDVHASAAGSAAAKGPSKHDAAGDDSHPG